MHLPHSPHRLYPLITLSLTAAIALPLFLFLNVHPLLAYLFAINLTTLLTYAHDQRAARNHKSRVPESTVHLLALLGGSPAALAAQQRLRHKTSKRSFQLTYWGIVVVQAAVLVCFWAR